MPRTHDNLSDDGTGPMAAAATLAALGSVGDAEGGMLSSEDMETFQLFSSEMFDPSIFEGFHQSPIDPRTIPAGPWDGTS